MTPGPAKQFDREQALESAMRLFWQKGYDAVGVSDLLAEMQIGRQSMYDTFGSKHQLFLAALEAYAAAQVRTVRGALRGPGSPLERIDGAFTYWKEMVAQGHGCFAGNSLSELGPRDEVVGRILQRGLGKVAEAFRETLEEAVETGELRPEIDARGMADLIVITGQGVAAVTQVKACEDLAMTGWSYLETIIDRYRTDPRGPAGTTH